MAEETVTAPATDSTTRTLYCSFCGKSQYEVKKLVAGPSAFICNECAELCLDIWGKIPVPRENITALQIALKALPPEIYQHQAMRPVATALQKVVDCIPQLPEEATPHHLKMGEETKLQLEQLLETPP